MSYAASREYRIPWPTGGVFAHARRYLRQVRFVDKRHSVDVCRLLSYRVHRQNFSHHLPFVTNLDSYQSRESIPKISFQQAAMISKMDGPSSSLLSDEYLPSTVRISKTEHLFQRTAFSHKGQPVVSFATAGRYDRQPTF